MRTSGISRTVRPNACSWRNQRWGCGINTPFRVKCCTIKRNTRTAHCGPFLFAAKWHRLRQSVAPHELVLRTAHQFSQHRRTSLVAVNAQSEQNQNICSLRKTLLEDCMSGKQSSRKVKSSDIRKRGEVNLGQREARLEKEKAS